MRTVSKFQPSVRYTNGLTIYFRDKHTIYVFSKSGDLVLQRWFDRKRGDYEKVWKPFCSVLYRNNNLDTIWKIMNLAQRYGIEMSSSLRKLEIPEGIRVRPSRYIEK